MDFMSIRRIGPVPAARCGRHDGLVLPIVYRNYREFRARIRDGLTEFGFINGFLNSQSNSSTLTVLGDVH